MVSKKKLYRNMSIISFTMVFILALSLVLPLFTNAEEKDEKITMEFSVDKENNVITVSGKIPSNYNGYDLYWANKKFEKEKPQNPNENAKYLEDTIKWFESDENKIKPVTMVEGSTKINNSVSYKIGNYYSVLCVAKGPNNTIMMSYANYTSSVPVEKKSEEIKIELNNEDKKISIHAFDDTAKITSIKIKKSDKALKVDDFNDGTAITGFTASNNVNVTTSVEDYGIYYVYAENNQGSKCVEPIVIKSPAKPQEDDISIEVYRITDEKYGDIAVKATSKTGRITGIKYYVSDEQINVEDEAGRNIVKQNGTEMKVYGNPTEEIVKSDGNIKDDKYIVIMVQSTDNNYNYEYWNVPGKIGNLKKEAVAPWAKTPAKNDDDEYEELKEESKKEETKTEEQPKVEETKKEENKQEEQPKAEETKKEESKTEEQPKAEENKNEGILNLEKLINGENQSKEQEQEQQKEEQKVEESKKEETKQQEAKQTVENKSSENKNTQSKTVENVVKNENNKETKVAELKKDIEASVYGTESTENVTTKVSGDNKSNKALPQTGTNNTWIYVEIVVFAITGICGLIKARKE